MKKYLVTGIGPTLSGVGRLVHSLLPDASLHGYTVIARRSPRSIKLFLGQKKYYLAALEILYRAIDSFVFFIRLSFIKNSTVIFLHPQTAGFRNLFKLIKHNSVFLYVMDNSFFCVRSYNQHPKDHGECLRCITGPNALEDCEPFPVPLKKETNIRYIKQLRKVAHSVYFLCQNKAQQDLVIQCFGVKTRTEVVGMSAADGELNRPFFVQRVEQSTDLVYHGAVHLAKGLGYFIKLAENLSEYSAFIPASRDACETAVGRPILSKNIVFKECSWESGLKHEVIHGGITFNPSLWSAPIEGALVKSFFFAKTVATVESEYSFESELISDKHLRLPLDISRACEVIRACLSEGLEEATSDQFVELVFPALNIFDLVSRASSILGDQ